LLIAASLLLTGGWKGRLGAMMLTGYMTIWYFYRSSILDGSVMDALRYLGEIEPSFIGSWNSQYIFSMIVFAFASAGRRGRTLARP